MARLPRCFFVAAFGVVLLAAWVGVQAAPYDQVVLADAPYGYWRFGEASGTTAANLGSGGAALNGDYARFAPPDGIPVLGVPGIPGGGGDTAAQFTGTTPVSQVFIPDTVNPTEYTLEAWVKPAAGATTSRSIFVRTAADPRSTWSHQLRLNAEGQFEHYTYDGAERWVPYPWAPNLTIAQPDEWYHVVATARQGGGMELYVNGAREGYWPGALGTIWAGGNQWRVGAVSGHGMDWFDGAIDELALYHQVLSPTQIHEHYRAGMGIEGVEYKPFASPADLDLEGDMVYAIDVGGRRLGLPVQGVQFGWDGASTGQYSGITVNAENVANPWGTKPEFGDTPSANDLETVMHGIRWSWAPRTVDLDLDVVPGNTYKLQLMFAENFWSTPGQRTFDVSIEGQKELAEFDILAAAGGQSQGVVYAKTLTATDNKLNISLTPGATGPDLNPLINAVTLEFLQGSLVPEVVRRDSPRISLRLGEAPGATTALDSAQSGGSQDGTYLGGVTLGVPGIPANAAEGNTAARFDGADDRVQVMDPAQPIGYAVEAWVKPDPGAVGGRGILVRTAGNPNTTWSHQLRTTPDGRFEHYAWDGAMRWVQGSTPIQADEWHHVVGVYTPGSPGEMELFVDGVREARWVGTLNNPWAGGNQWLLASESGQGFIPFAGALDEVQVYDHALDPRAIERHYRASAHPNTMTAVWQLDLADMVGGGDGTGTGGHIGIDQRDGSFATTHTGAAPDPAVGLDARYHPVPAHPFIDGVFVPGTTSATGGVMKVASTGITVAYPDRSGESWDFVYNGTHNGSESALNGVDYASTGHSMLGLHANKGITFDLDAIRAANPGLEVGRFRTMVGNGTSSAVDYNVYVDGVLKQGALISGRQGIGYSVDIPLSIGDRFLTLVASDGGDGYGWDQVIFGDPELEVGHNIARGAQVISNTIGFYQAGTEVFPFGNLTDGRLNDIGSPANWSFWLGPNGATGEFVLDLGQSYLLERMDLQNTHNRQYNDRGTADFRVFVSEDGMDWEEILDRTLPSAWGTGGVLPLHTYLFDPVDARYVRFQVDSFYGAGAGLNELRLYERIPEPGTLALLGLGLLALARRRRRG